MSERKLSFVAVAPSKTRAGDRRVIEQDIPVDEVAKNLNQFLEDMDAVLQTTPQKVGKFEFSEFELYAEVSTEGTLKILGTGLQAGAMGGLKFVFRRPSQ